METNTTLFGCASIIGCMALTSCSTSGSLMTSSNRPDPAPQEISSYQEINNPQELTTSKLKKPIAESIVTFSDDNSGSVYISVAGTKLFKPGSAVIDAKGKKVLRPIADLLYTGSEDFSMEVKGAIGSEELKNAKYTTGWDLSQARASSLMQVMSEPGREAQKASIKKAKKEATSASSNQLATPAGQAVVRKYILVLDNSL